MKIAQLMAGAREGGAELFYERLSAALHGAGEDVLPVIRRDAARAGRLRAAGLQPAQYTFGGPLDLLTRPRVRRRLERFRPEIVVSWMNRATQQAPRGDWVHVGRLGGYYNLEYYRECDHLVGNTRGIVAWLRTNGWPAERTHYLPNFVHDFATAVPEAGLLGAAPLLLALGRLHRDKGFDTLIRALPRLPGASLAIAGEGPERAALLALARREGVQDRVALLGWQSDVGPLLKAAAVFVCSSRREPLGNAVIEAWSAARPIVAADADGPRELITDGEDGRLVPMDDPAALADAIAAVLGDHDAATRMAEAGRRRFLAEFSEAAVLGRWRSFLRGLRP